MHHDKQLTMEVMLLFNKRSQQVLDRNLCTLQKSHVRQATRMAQLVEVEGY